MKLNRSSISAVAMLAATPCLDVDAAEFWTGPRILFSKADAANPLLPANQDRLSDGIWITRGANGGIFNARSESGYDFAAFSSPSGTEWVFNRSLADGIDGVQFRPWAQAANMNPPSTVGVNAVLHLIAEDVYIDVMFTSWQINCCGGFAYERSTPPAPVAPASPQQVPALPWPLALVLGGLLSGLALRRHR